jgi:outer membrane protein
LTGTWSQLGLDQNFTDSVDRVFDGDFYDWSAGILLEVPLSNRGPRAQYRNARDLQMQLSVEKQKLENSIVLEVDKAIRDLEYAYRAVVNLKEQVRLQNDLFDAEKKKLEVGTSTPYLVSLIENDLVAFEAQLFRAIADCEIAKAAYERATGNLLAKRGVKLGE